MFDFDPDEMADEIEEEAEAVAEEIEDEFADDEEDLEAEEDGYGLKEAAVGAAIFGMGENSGEEEAKRRSLEKKGMKAKIKGERPEGSVSLKDRKGKSKLPRFEQWVKDVISGKKTLDDEL